MKPPRRQRVAIVGSGMAGLVAGYLLANDKEGRFEVEVLEMQDCLSLDSASYTLPRPRQPPFPPPCCSDAVSVPTNGTGTANGSTVKPKSASTIKTQTQTQTAETDEQDEGEERVDLPMRAFAAGYYDNLRKLYTHLGVTFEEPRFVYSLSTLASTGDSPTTKKRTQTDSQTYFIHSSNNHILPPIRPQGLSLLRWVIEAAYLFFWYTYFTFACFLIAPRRSEKSSIATKCGLITARTQGETLRSFLTRIHVPTYYTTRYFLPLMASVTTCTHDELLNFPARDIVTYARRTFRRPHYTVRGGVRQAEGKLSKGLKVKFGAKVTSVKTLEDGSGRVKVRWRWTHSSSAKGRSDDGRVGADSATSSSATAIAEREEHEEYEEEVYDKAIIAVTPDVVGSIFEPLANEMADIPTTSVQSVVHQDFARIGASSAHLRGDPRFQSRTIMATSSSSSSSRSNPTLPVSGPVSAAIHMFTDLHTGRTESVHEHRSSMLITTYPIDNAIDEAKILHRAKFTRVLRSARSREVVNGIFNLGLKSVNKEGEGEDGWKSGDGNVYLVGGWCWDGMVMLEGCIVSAIRVADALGVDVPWAR
ncbi:hypothetical protein BJY01DRAFT_251093 [Aspergillus pseudoustus]|uniref:Amine oxidase domain-containing protein n=1 Tax=Aspergillus pseudoustus TaxID=1810923 RepID=A0ABR4JDS5_9EURO